MSLIEGLFGPKPNPVAPSAEQSDETNPNKYGAPTGAIDMEPVAESEVNTDPAAATTPPPASSDADSEAASATEDDGSGEPETDDASAADDGEQDSSDEDESEEGSEDSGEDQESEDEDPPAATPSLKWPKAISWSPAFAFMNKKGEVTEYQEAIGYLSKVTDTELASLLRMGITPDTQMLKATVQQRIHSLEAAGLIRLTVVGVCYDSDGNEDFEAELEGEELRIMLAAYGRRFTESERDDALERNLQDVLAQLTPPQLRDLGGLMGITKKKSKGISASDLMNRAKKLSDRQALLNLAQGLLNQANPGPDPSVT